MDLPICRWRLSIVIMTVLALLYPPIPVRAATEQQVVVLAEKYYRTDKRRSFAKQVGRLSADSVYQPLIAYWQSVIALRQKKPEQVEHYIATAASPYLQMQARRRLLEHYADKKQWDKFNRHADDGGACASALKALLSNAADGAAVRTLWQDDTKMNQSLCMTLYRHAYAKRLLSEDDIWVKLRALAGDKQLSASRRLLSHFHGFISYRQVRSVVRRATRYISGRHGLASRAERELVMISAMAAVRRNPKTAISRWQKFSQYFSDEENDHVHTVLATWAARWHRDDALKIFASTSGKYADEQARAWRVRSALRAGDYAEVLQTINTMPPAEKNLSAWRYWRAVALQAQDAAAATAALTALAEEEDDYYGLLAREAVGMPLVDSKPPPPQAISAAATVGGDFQLAVAAHRAGLKSLARALWRHAARQDAAGKIELMAAAQLAATAGWPLASIDAAIRADDAAAHHLRYPFPYKEEIFAHSKKRGLDLAFVYGLIHQESRFMPSIVSSAKARGLMQVIPRTAHQVARANGYSKYRLSRLTRVDTNVTIGTTYLQSLAEGLNAAPAMVAAAYNAGPSRVKRWYRSSPEILVAIENIPITETRLYVKYLLANRLHYAARLGREVPSMLDNIGRPMMTAAS